LIVLQILVVNASNTCQLGQINMYTNDANARGLFVRAPLPGMVTSFNDSKPAHLHIRDRLCGIQL